MEKVKNSEKKHKKVKNVKIKTVLLIKMIKNLAIDLEWKKK